MSSASKKRKATEQQQQEQPVEKKQAVGITRQELIKWAGSETVAREMAQHWRMFQQERAHLTNQSRILVYDIGSVDQDMAEQLGRQLVEYKALPQNIEDLSTYDWIEVLPGSVSKKVIVQFLGPSSTSRVFYTEWDLMILEIILSEFDVPFVIESASLRSEF